MIHKSGFVSILGRPNAGKSTLLNALVGQKVSIVADKPQTTRTAIQGVMTTPGSQVIFVDTPGIHKSDSAINKRMMAAVRAKHDLLPLMEEYGKRYAFAACLPVSALKEDGLDKLREEVVSRLPEGP